MNRTHCIICKIPIKNVPWTLLHDFCPKHQSEWWAEMDAEELRLNIYREWEEYILWVEEVNFEGDGTNVDRWEWDWADWLSEGELQTLKALYLRCCELLKT